MPRFNGTGPNGEGPLTGGRMGNCGQTGGGGGRGQMRGMGRGRGASFLGTNCGRVRGCQPQFKMGVPQEFSELEQKELLNDRLKELKNEKEEIEKMIKSLDSNK